MKRRTRQSFIEDAVRVHNDKYTYSNVVFTNTSTKVSITCPDHGDFMQTPHDHLSNHGCPKCRIIASHFVKRHDDATVIEMMTNKHDGVYDYSLVNYVNVHTKIDIICDIHGTFSVKPNNHLRGSGCPDCARLLRNGWERGTWVKRCERYNKEACMVYIIRLYNDNESFIKIGLTSNTVADRFYRQGWMPYKIEVVKEIILPPLAAFNKERELHKMFKRFKYKPLLDFPGKSECFKLEILNQIQNA